MTLLKQCYPPDHLMFGSDVRCAMEQSAVCTYEKILDQVLTEIPDCRITLMAYYPVNYEAAIEEMKPVLEIRSNEKIMLANQAVREMARRKGLRFIDVNDPLKDELGRLKAEYTIEGMHITEDGYRAIYPLVRNYLINPD